MVDATIRHNMTAVAITDHANLMGAFHFINYTERRNKDLDEDQKIKPIIGCEFFVCETTKIKVIEMMDIKLFSLLRTKRAITI